MYVYVNIRGASVCAFMSASRGGLLILPFSVFDFFVFLERKSCCHSGVHCDWCDAQGQQSGDGLHAKRPRSLDELFRFRERRVDGRLHGHGVLSRSHG